MGNKCNYVGCRLLDVQIARLVSLILKPSIFHQEAKRKQEDKEAQTKEDAAIQAADEAAAERMADDFARQVQYW